MKKGKPKILQRKKKRKTFKVTHPKKQARAQNKKNPGATLLTIKFRDNTGLLYVI
jgi:hypothetical protein